MVEEIVHGGIGTARHHREVTDRLHEGVGALVLGRVDAALDVNRYLHVAAV